MPGEANNNVSVEVMSTFSRTALDLEDMARERATTMSLSLRGKILKSSRIKVRSCKKATQAHTAVQRAILRKS